ncbi:MAG: response regulator [Parcubacteria group bacterium]
MAKKILLIEDEELLINLLQKKLTESGFSVFLARNGEEGLKLMRENMPDIVLLDIVMPKMGGFEVLEKMAKEDSLKKIPVIIISNSGQPVEIDRAKRLGVKDWLIKTEFDPEEVLEKVIAQIGK